MSIRVDEESSSFFERRSGPRGVAGKMLDRPAQVQQFTAAGVISRMGEGLLDERQRVRGSAGQPRGIGRRAQPP